MKPSIWHRVITCARRRVRVVLLAGLASLAVASAGVGQEQAKTIKVQLLGIADDMYVFSGGGGNSVVLVTDEGVVIVDTKLAGWGAPMLSAVQALTERPVTLLINTHTHGDHTGSNAEMPSVTRIVAHEQTKTHMQSMPAFSGTAARGLPTDTFRDRLTLLDGANRIELYHFGAGHTNGDAVVVFPAKGVAHLGDLFPSKSAPVIDIARGGSGVAYPDTLAKAAAALDGQVTKIVTGHEPPPPGSPIRGMTGVADLKEFAEFTREFLDAVRAAHKAGLSAQDAAASLKLSDRFKAYDMRRAAANVEAIYRELK